MIIKNKWQISLGVLIILIITIGVIRKNVKRHQTHQEVTNEVGAVYGAIQVFISTTGIVEPQNRLEIVPPISGRIDKILVSEGEEVKTGQILAWMSSSERAALLDAARPKGEKTLKYWQEAYKPAPLIAPIDGEIIVRAVEPGQTVTATTPILVIADRLIVKAQVDETDIGKVRIGEDADVSLDAYPDVEVTGKVDHIAYESKIVNNVTVYEVDILPETVPEVFRSGMSANVDIVSAGKEQVLLVPVEAVKRDQEGSFVILIQGKGMTPSKRKVETGICDNKNIEIISGLKEGDQVLLKTKKYVLPQSKKTGSNPFMPFGRKKK